MSDHLKPIVEALIFASPEPITPKTLFKLPEGEPREDVQAALDAVKADYERPGGLQIVEVAGGTVKAALADLLRQFPGVGPKLFDNGKLRPYVNVFVNDEDIRYLDELDTALTDGQTVALIPAVAGG